MSKSTSSSLSIDNTSLISNSSSSPYKQQHHQQQHRERTISSTSHLSSVIEGLSNDNGGEPYYFAESDEENDNIAEYNELGSSPNLSSHIHHYQNHQGHPQIHQVHQHSGSVGSLPFDPSNPFSYYHQNYSHGYPTAGGPLGNSFGAGGHGGNGGVMPVYAPPYNFMLQEDNGSDSDDGESDFAVPAVVSSSSSGPGRKRSSNSVSSVASNSSTTRRSRGPSNPNKECASCGTRKTPMWRDDADGVPLCNACGIRFKKNKSKCIQCNYVPRKDDSNQICKQCGGQIILCRR